MPNPPNNRRQRPDAGAVCAVIGLPFEWCDCDVRDGSFFYGQENVSLLLPSFQMAKYPVTFAQFQTFVDAEDGFFRAEWWEGLNCDSNHQAEPALQRFCIADHPRENVSWYDAIAFCRWLSYRLNTPYDLNRIAEWAVRLPTVFEWERAARGNDQRVYPYALNRFDPKKSNTRESGVGRTTPVTAYPHGASPVGALDMSGNVFEWCLSQANNPAQEAASEDLGSILLRSARGGSWDYPADVARVDRIGFRCMPDDRGQETGDGQIGFWIVCSI